MPKFSATPYDQAAEAEFKQKDILFKMMRESKSYEKHAKHKALYDALMLSLIQKEDDLDRVIPDLRKRDLNENEDPFAGSNQGKRKRSSRKESEPSKTSLESKETSKGETPSKSSKTSKFASAKELVKEATHEVTIGEEKPVHENVNDVDQPQDDSEPQTDNALKKNWFKKPPRPPTLDPLTFDELMTTPIDFSKFAKNRLKLDNITKANFVGPVYNLLKGTCDRCPFDLSKPLPLKGHPGHLTIASEYFFNNDLEYLKSTDSERKYTTSILKMKAARFSKNDVYSLLKILSVVSVKVNKLHGYGYLEEIVVVSKPHGKRAIGTKWVYRNKKDERGIVIRNKARIKAIRLFLAYASFKDFVVYQMDMKSEFLYGKIEEEVYVYQPPGFEDPEFPDKVYKVEIALYGLHQAPRAWYETLSTYLLDNRFQRGHIDKTLFIKRVKGDILLMSSMGELNFFLGLQVTQKDDGIFISQDKYVDEILKKFGFSTVKTASTPMETSKPFLKDTEAEDVDVHLYRSMIGSLMYLTASRPDIMFAVCACARFQVTPKVSHLHAVKRIFRYLKGQPKLGLWYPKDSPFDLEAYTDSDYAGASLDKKSTTGAEYVAASSCCGQLLWIQNQMLDYGYNFMNTKIFIDNESTICIAKNPVFHLKT
ncbi:putative ribonuclease H-like domain-containing protein [Tanacetum coccineum]|uniref:Ribonuclease H-like domain-containing protein n=1 Tax=Tanacetum coccineum TaxID=301880 RepID=A0ABQ4ZFH8_9ASTR